MQALTLILFAAWCVAAIAAEVPSEALRHRASLIREARVQWGLTAPVATFAAQIHQESRWRAEAISPVGARGMAQVMPATADWLVRSFPGLSFAGGHVAAPLSPTWAIRALVTYDYWLWQRLDGANECERMALALRAYNGGLGWIQRDQMLADSRGINRRVNFGQLEQVNAGRNPSAFAENIAYPHLILSHQPRYVAAGFGRGVCA